MITSTKVSKKIFTTLTVAIAILAGTFLASNQSAYAKKPLKPKTTPIENPHKITNPQTNPTLWSDTMKQTRIAELFKTKDGLRGHAQQIEQEIARANKNLDGKKGKEVVEYQHALNKVKQSIISSAKGAKFDFDKFVIKFTPLGSDLHLERRGGKLFVNGR